MIIISVSGSFQNYPKTDFGLYCEWSAPHNVSGNYSSVGVTVYLVYRSLDIGSRTCTISINGQSHNFSTPAISDYSSGVKKRVLAQKVVNVSHNSDGKKVCSISINFDARLTYSGTYYSNIVANANVNLFSIPRQSTISSYSNSVTVNGKNALNVSFNTHSSSYQHEFRVDFGSSHHYELLSAGRTNVNFVVPLQWLENIPNSQQGKGTLSITTKNGSSTIGTPEYRDFTVWVSGDVVPVINSINVEMVNDNAVVRNWGIYLKGYSKAKVTCNGYGVYGAPIASYSFTGAYYITQTSKTYTGGILNTSGGNKINCKVSDTRGKDCWGVEQSFFVYDYVLPEITEITVNRISNNNKRISVRGSCTYANLDGKNNISLNLYYKKSSSSNWILYGSIPQNVNVELSNNFDEFSSYNFRLTVSDTLGNTNSVERFVSTMEVLMDFRSGGKGLGIGKISESDSLEVAMRANFTNEICHNGVPLNTIINNSLSSYLNNPNSVYDTDWIGFNFQNGWNVSESTRPWPAYRRMGNVVHIRGILKGGNGSSTITNLPIGFRPRNQQSFLAFCANSSTGTTHLVVEPNGNIFSYIPAGNEGKFYSLDGISFILT